MIIEVAIKGGDTSRASGGTEEQAVAESLGAWRSSNVWRWTIAVKVEVHRRWCRRRHWHHNFHFHVGFLEEKFEWWEQVGKGEVKGRKKKDWLKRLENLWLRGKEGEREKIVWWIMKMREAAPALPFYKSMHQISLCDIIIYYYNYYFCRLRCWCFVGFYFTIPLSLWPSFWFVAIYSLLYCDFGFFFFIFVKNLAPKGQYSKWIYKNYMCVDLGKLNWVWIDEVSWMLTKEVLC